MMLEDTVQIDLPEEVNDEVIQSFGALLKSGDDEQAFRGLKSLRMVISKRNRDPMYAMIVRNQIVADVAPYVDSDSERHAFEACWILTNVAARKTDIALTVVHSGGIPRLINAIRKTDSISLAEQAIWALANIAGEGQSYRSTIIRMGVVDSLLKFATMPMGIKNLRNITWAIGNLARTPMPETDIKTCAGLVPAMAYLFSTVGLPDGAVSTNTTALDVISDIVFFCSFIADGDDDDIATVIGTGITPKIVETINYPYSKLSSASIRCVGNLMSSEKQEDSDYLISCGVVPALVRSLSSKFPAIRRESAWALSNIVAGGVDNLKVIQDHNVIPTALRQMNSDIPEVATECVWIILNFIVTSPDAQFQYAVECDAIENLLLALRNMQSHRAKMLILECIRKMLDHQPTLTDRVAATGGVVTLNNLIYNNYASVANAADAIVTMYFGDSDDEDEEPLPAFNLGGV